MGNRKLQKSEDEILKIVGRIFEKSTTLHTTRSYSLAEICGKEWWAEEVSDERGAGQIISQIAHAKHLPLRPAGKRYNNHRQYFIDHNYQQEKICQ